MIPTVTYKITVSSSGTKKRAPNYKKSHLNIKYMNQQEPPPECKEKFDANTNSRLLIITNNCGILVLVRMPKGSPIEKLPR